MIPGDNPYSPPTIHAGGVPDAPESSGWELIRGTVWARTSSQFPMVDPFTGETAETMCLQKVEVRLRPRWLGWLVPAGALAMLFLFPGRDPGPEDLVIPGLAGMCLGWMFSMPLGLVYPVCTLKVFFERRTVRIRTLTTQTLNGFFLTGILGGLFNRQLPAGLNWIPLIAIILWLVGLPASMVFHRRLRCRRKSGDLFEIRGFHPKALAALAPET